jgi:hypothetical protein
MSRRYGEVFAGNYGNQVYPLRRMRSPRIASRLFRRVGDHLETVSTIAYETQARYAPGEAWITIDVSICRQTAIDEALFRRDPWGRRPIELRMLAVTSRRRSR